MEEFDRELIAAMDQRIAEVEAGGLAADWTAAREGAARIFSRRTPDVQKPPGCRESQSV
ncbi:hypothetical protein GCM10023148_03470 [Actinokineospora soli]